MHVVIDVSALGWSAQRAAELPPDCVAGRVSRVDRGRLSVLTADGECRAHPAAALFDESGLPGPAGGGWGALRGGLAVAALPPTRAFVRSGARPAPPAPGVAAH